MVNSNADLMFNLFRGCKFGHKQPHLTLTPITSTCISIKIKGLRDKIWDRQFGFLS